MVDDYGSIMGSAAKLTNIYPDVQAALLGQQQQQANALQIQQAQQAMQQQQAFQSDFSQVMQNPTPQGIGQLIAAHPKFAEPVSKAWEVYAKPAKDAKLKTAADVVGYLQAGDPAGAARVLREHFDADKAAGVDTTEYEHLIDIINTDPKQALTLGMFTLAAGMGPDKFAEAYKALNPSDRVAPVQKEYDWRVQQFGKGAADQWLATQDTKLVPVQAGGQVYAYGGASPNAEGGDQSTGASDPASILQTAKQSGTITPADAVAVRKSLGANGQAAFQKWLTENNITVAKGRVEQTRSVGGATYYQIGGKWYDNPEGK